MNQPIVFIYEILNLKKSFGKYTALNIGRLQFHRGTIYGVVGPIGSGKTSLFKIMAGKEKSDSGSILYDSTAFETNWLGQTKAHPEIFLASVDLIPKSKKVSKVIQSINKNQMDRIVSRHFNTSVREQLLDRTVSSLSPGELAWLNMVIAVESDPRVLLVDDYATLFDPSLEKEFRTMLVKMNKDLGTTIILSAPSDYYLKNFTSVLIYLDNGHVSKIRSGVSRMRRPLRSNGPKRSGSNQKRSPVKRSTNKPRSRNR